MQEDDLLFLACCVCVPTRRDGVVRARTSAVQVHRADGPRIDLVAEQKVVAHCVWRFVCAVRKPFQTFRQMFSTTSLR